MSQPVIEVRGIVNRFGAQVVHDRLDMQVMDGEVFGIVGGSGAGKSVLLRTILGLQRPRAGQVILYGRDINSLSERELREVKTALWSHLPAGRLVLFLERDAERTDADDRVL